MALTPQMPMTLDGPRTEFSHTVNEAISEKAQKEPWKQISTLARDIFFGRRDRDWRLNDLPLFLCFCKFALVSPVDIPPPTQGGQQIICLIFITQPSPLGVPRTIINYVINCDDVTFLTISRQRFKFLAMFNMGYLFSSPIFIMNLKRIFNSYDGKRAPPFR